MNPSELSAFMHKWLPQRKPLLSKEILLAIFATTKRISFGQRRHNLTMADFKVKIQHTNIKRALWDPSMPLLFSVFLIVDTWIQILESVRHSSSSSCYLVGSFSPSCTTCSCSYLCWTLSPRVSSSGSSSSSCSSSSSLTVD